LFEELLLYLWKNKNMELTEELRGLRDDLFGLGLDDSASREVKVSVKDKDNNEKISFVFESPTYERDVVRSIIDICEKIVDEDEDEDAVAPFINWATSERLKVFGIHIEEDLNNSSNRNSILSFFKAMVNNGGEHTFKKLSATAEWSLGFNGSRELSSIEVSVLQKNEWETIYSYEFKLIFGSSGISGVSGLVGVSGKTGVSGSFPTTVTYTSELEEPVSKTIGYADYIDYFTNPKKSTYDEYT
jgi:hypothetical protein